MPRFQIISDLHLETKSSYTCLHDYLIPSAEYLILAGDIGNPLSSGLQQFLSDVSKAFFKVYYVFGNHEYYNWMGKPLFEMSKLLRDIISAFNNIYILDNTTEIVDDKYIIIGTTLWSHCPPHAEKALIEGLNDYKHIWIDKNINITPKYLNTAFRNNVIFIEHEILKAKKKKLMPVVVTHHLPSFMCVHEKYRNSPINNGFASSLDDIICEKNMACWIHGHTHDPVDIEISGCKIKCNPMGYFGERMTHNKTCIVDV